MDSKIQELTSKIYQEGVERGKEEADRIISEAKSERDSILKNAKEEADATIASAKKEADELKKNTEAELKMFASQSVEALKTEVVNLITTKVVANAVSGALNEKDFMQKMILEMAKEWAKNDSITIQSADADALSKFFTANATELLNNGVKIEKVNGKSSSFNILPKDGSYKVTFGEDEFIAYFKEFLRPKLIEMLF